MKIEITTICIAVCVSIFLGSLEYYYITIDGLPYRLARQPIAGIYYYYHIVGIVPLIALCSFHLFIQKILAKSLNGLKRCLALGVSTFLLCLIIEDVVWFASRTLNPMKNDPLGYKWLQPSDYTAAILGYADLFGFLVPIWYLVFLPPIIAVFSAMIILPKE